MTGNIVSLCEELKESIKNTYTLGVSLDEAEKLAAKFLYAQMQVSEVLQAADLDTRMKKNGVKAIRAAVYMQEATKGDKKPSDVMLDAQVNRDGVVAGEQVRYDKAECERQALENYYNIFREAHIYYRGIAKGRFE